MYKFLPIAFFIVELGAVYTVATVAAAHVPPVTMVAAKETIQPRVVRIAVIKKESIDPVSVVATEIKSESKKDAPENGEEPVVVKNEVAGAAAALQSVPNFQEGKLSESAVHSVPFYSQFSDITAPAWQKVGCGIASLAMLIEFHTEQKVSVDALLTRGINAGAYLDNAGWIHAGLINLSKTYGLTGESVSLSHLSMDEAFSKLQTVLERGPVMVSVHYTFEPTNPIPHLVVITGVKDGKVFYNDPAEAAAAGSLSIEKFERAWKKRYISIVPA